MENNMIMENANAELSLDALDDITGGCWFKICKKCKAKKAEKKKKTSWFKRLWQREADRYESLLNSF